MKKYAIKRTLTSLLTLFAVLLVLFILMHLMPGSPFNDEKLNDDQKAEFRNEAFIPDDVGLELEHFEEFYEKRKALLTSKIRQLLG